MLILSLGLISRFGGVSAAGPVGTAFTYQGRLIDANNAADGLYDFQFKLYDANVAGTQKGSTIDVNKLDVIDGYFTALLDFGSVFDGNDRWLAIGVRAGELKDPNVYTVLSPRQKVTPTPYALYAKTAGGGGGGADSDWIISGNNMYSGVSGNVGIGTTPSNYYKLTVAGGYTTVRASNSDDYGVAVYGDSNASGIVTNYGGYFGAAGSYGQGVTGVASNNGDYINYGGFFEASGQRGQAVYGKTMGTYGRGVYGYAYGNYGYGVYGEAYGSNGRGVYGIAAGDDGYGVSGVASNSGNFSNHGGYFAAAGQGGRGVQGYASHTSGTNFGVYGSTNSPNGYAGYFWGGKNYFQGNVGIGTTSPARALHVSDVIRLQPRATAPSSPAEGDIYMDSTTHTLMVYNGTIWKPCF